MNEATTKDDDVPRLGRFCYSNQPYGIAGFVVEKVSGQKYADFLQERILYPLGMTDTIVSHEGLSRSKDVAIPYAKLCDRSYAEIATYDYFNTISLPAIGIRSSVRDMRTWAKAHSEAQTPDGNPQDNPLCEIPAIWIPQATMEPDTDYSLGWYRGLASDPSLLQQGRNYQLATQEPEKFTNSYVLVCESPKLHVIGHTGSANGFAASLFIFPKTSSAVVAPSNGLDTGHSADFAV